MKDRSPAYPVLNQPSPPDLRAPHWYRRAHTIGFAPCHQLVAGKARIGTHQDGHLGPAAADPGNDARHRLHCAVRRIQARPPQLGVHQGRRTRVLPAQAAKRTTVNVTILNDKGEKVFSDVREEKDMKLIEGSLGEPN
jgi:hypothetical protein